MDYDQLRAQFVGLLNRRDLTPTLRDTFIKQSIQRIQRTLRVPAMEKSLRITADGTTNKVALPRDYLELVNLVDETTNYRIQRSDLTTVRQTATLLGEYPKIFAREGRTLLLAPTPPGGATLRMDYYADFSGLSEGTDSNILTDIAPDLIVYGALSYATDYFLDKRKDQFEGTYQRIFMDLQDQADRDELSGGVSVKPTYSYPPDSAYVYVQY